MEILQKIRNRVTKIKSPSVHQVGVFAKTGKGLYRSFNRLLWKEFWLHELVEIIMQSIDSGFAQLFNRVRERLANGQ